MKYLNSDTISKLLFNLVRISTVSYDLIGHHELLNHDSEILSYNYEISSHYYGILSHNFVILNARTIVAQR